jgi:hypothetical protein
MTVNYRRLTQAVVHWDASDHAASSLPGPAPELFFAPAHILKRREQWGTENLRTRVADAWAAFLAYIVPWLGIEFTIGRSSVERVYREVLDGRTPASPGSPLV